MPEITHELGILIQNAQIKYNFVAQMKQNCANVENAVEMKRNLSEEGCAET